MFKSNPKLMLITLLLRWTFGIYIHSSDAEDLQTETLAKQYELVKS